MIALPSGDNPQAQNSIRAAACPSTGAYAKKGTSNVMRFGGSTATLLEMRPLGHPFLKGFCWRLQKQSLLGGWILLEMRPAVYDALLESFTRGRFKGSKKHRTTVSILGVLYKVDSSDII